MADAEKSAEPGSQGLKDAKVAELTDSLKRLQAEYENYRKRRDKEEQERLLFFNATLVAKLLPILDAFDAANKHEDKESFRKGVAMIYTELKSVLQGEGLKKLELVGKEFDPFNAEVMLQTVEPEKAGTVTQELQAGYMFKDRVLRHAKVAVAVESDCSCEESCDCLKKSDSELEKNSGRNEK